MHTLPGDPVTFDRTRGYDVHGLVHMRARRSAWLMNCSYEDAELLVEIRTTLDTPTTCLWCIARSAR